MHCHLEKHENGWAARVCFPAFVLVGAACGGTLPGGAVQSGSAGGAALTDLGSQPLLAAAMADGAPESGALAPDAQAEAAPPRRNRVDANGVRGELVPVPFLSQQELGQSLIMVDWEIPGGAEHFLCGRVTVPSDVYIRGFEPMSPPGTHHTALTIREAPNARDGVTECDVSEVGATSVFGSGVGTLGAMLPDGLGVKIAAGSQILFNLHVFNASETPLRGRSGTLAQTTTADTIRELADGVAVGPLKLTVPPGRSVQSGVCTVDRDYSIYGLMPHMHETGVHMRVVARPAGIEPVLLHDGPFIFDNQVALRFPALALHKGDTITIECTFDNPFAYALHFGESSKDEMCIAAVARFPAGGKSTCPF